MNQQEKIIPEFFINRLQSQYTQTEINQILKGYSTNRKVTLRVNTIKSNNQEIEKILTKNNISFSKVKWSEIAFIINNASEEELRKLSIYEEGKIYLQSLSSMLPPIILEPEEGEDILDMAAAPGGKTTQIAALTNNLAHITACELNNIRAEKLKYNLEKQGVNSAFVMQKDARNIDDFFSFDRILLDAPCSGSGTLDLEQKNTFKYFTEVLIEKSAKTQLTLLRKAIKLLKTGKEIIYSTCSILSKENEEIVQKVLNENPNIEIVPIQFNGDEDIPKLPVKLPGTLCVCPNKLYEGFFIAKLRKK